LAEMTAVLNQRNGGMLKHRSRPIHSVDLLVSQALAHQQAGVGV